MILRESRSIKVLLADSDHDWQQRLATLINSEPDMKVSGIVSTKETAIQASMQLQIEKRAGLLNNFANIYIME